MSDTIAVALIAVGGTLGSGALSYVAAARNSKVQLASVEVEVQKLNRTHAQESRLERLQVYHDFLHSVDQLEELVIGFTGELTQENLYAGSSTVGDAFSRLVLLGQEDVVKEGEAVMAAIAAFSRAAAAAAEEDEERSFDDCARIAGEQKLGEWSKVRNRMRAAMRRDLA